MRRPLTRPLQGPHKDGDPLAWAGRLAWPRAAPGVRIADAIAIIPAYAEDYVAAAQNCVASKGALLMKSMLIRYGLTALVALSLAACAAAPPPPPPDFPPPPGRKLDAKTQLETGRTY
jgi:hypothetical protein